MRSIPSDPPPCAHTHTLIHTHTRSHAHTRAHTHIHTRNVHAHTLTHTHSKQCALCMFRSVVGSLGTCKRAFTMSSVLPLPSLPPPKVLTLILCVDEDKQRVLLGLKKRGQSAFSIHHSPCTMKAPTTFLAVPQGFGVGKWNGFGGKVEPQVGTHTPHTCTHMPRTHTHTYTQTDRQTHIHTRIHVRTYTRIHTHCHNRTRVSMRQVAPMGRARDVTRYHTLMAHSSHHDHQ